MLIFQMTEKNLRFAHFCERNRPQPPSLLVNPNPKEKNMALHRSPYALFLSTLLAGMFLIPADASAQGNLRAGIPNLDPQVNGNDRPGQDYNSIAHTLGIHNQSIDPMTGPANAPFTFMDQVYGAQGYQRQNALDLRPAVGVQKVALYASTFPDGSIKQITHAALQEPDGSWSSKLGDLPLARHADASALDESQYGIPVATYVRQRGAANGGAFAGAFRQAGMRNLAPEGMDFGQGAMGDGGGGIALNDAGTNQGNNFGNPLNGGNQMNRQMPGNGFAKGAANAGNPKRQPSGGASANGLAGGGFVSVSASANGVSASAMVSFGGGIRQAGCSCFGNDNGNSNASNPRGSKGNTGTTGDLSNSPTTGSQAGNNIFVSIKGNNDTVSINAGPGGLVGKNLRIKIDGSNDTVNINTNGTSTNSAKTKTSNGAGSLVGTKSAKRTNTTQAIAKNSGTIRANSTTAVSKTGTHNAIRQVATTQTANATHTTAGVAKTGLTSNRSTGTAVRPRTTATTASMSNFARTGPMTNTLRAAASNRTYQPYTGNHFTANRLAVNHTATHSASTNISLARRR
jgi:hypothetical protein